MTGHIRTMLGTGCVVANVLSLSAQEPRARDLGVPFDGTPGPNAAITDVVGVQVGHVTLIPVDGPLVVGTGPVRTGVTAILPRGRTFSPGFAGWYSLNGNGEMTGTTWIEESGFLEGPVMITNTHSVGVVGDAVIEWMRDEHIYDQLVADLWWGLPVVAETWDGILNDINGFHVTREHAFQALNSATRGPVAAASTQTPGAPRALGIGRLGGAGTNGSGDIFLASSTANPDAWSRSETVTLEALPNDRMSALFGATAEATEEAILNALVAARTTVGINGNTAYALPHERLRSVLRRYNRLEQ